MKKIFFISILLTISFSFLSCQKEFLAKKPDKAVLVPATLEDFNALMDNLTIFNTGTALQEISADDFQVTDATAASFTTTIQKNSYTWATDIYENQPCSDWNIPYQQVFYANVILDGLETVKQDAASSANWNAVKGNALFHRAFAFYNLVQLFAKGYDKSTANTDLGIPIRLTADVNQKVGRGSVQQVYDQVLKDLLDAEKLLPVQTAYKSRPSRAAVNALLARIYLNMENYEQAKNYAASALALNRSLLDYNKLSLTAINPFPSSPANDNPEIIFYEKLISYGFTSSTRTTVADDLYQLYASKDLRKSIFFAGSGPYYVKGRYTGSRLQLFGGLTVDEMYLIHAECLARSGNFADAINELNTLLVTRWVKGTYTPLVAANADEALNIVLQERRKELAFRGLRWGDLKRLNKDQRFAKKISRMVSGTLYTLAPGDKRYVLPIPFQETSTSGIPQNER
ncbi:RagB/SusD family nutrient uptake outer membrane protein [Pedobacter rhodius]|uniref:RagB/SusD family nutrient uptake outer membrane protein n=1 Tax=Pedobacter rhodius TaxID=3004098 RepID=A0ABT4L458_9SPHI|nr:RagB/SusD family nutrient uptake outer membrane protein [Pedobacter sp. SJ11]MCZ4224833.1 RagB/SusD family nutrient uptake outer membrane protein [Pedobacter sp. SJ11]